MYGFTAHKEKMPANGTMFCRLRITCDKNIKDIIYRFYITTMFADQNGDLYTAVSDKKYYIASEMSH